ncbi:MAG: alpha/beta hydrolase [Thiolinea sp.]
MAVDGVTLPYVSEGKGSPVVFVHGAIADLRAWDAYRTIISEHHQFIAYSQRYFGTGDWPDQGENFQRATHIQDLIQFVEGLKLGPVHLVTWSYSGEIGVHAILQRPDLFLSAVHYEPVLDNLVAGVAGGANATHELFREFGPAVQAAQNQQPEDAALRFIEAVFELEPGKAVGEAGEPMWRDNGRTVPPYLAMKPPAALDCQDLGKLAVPTLVVQGAESFTRFSMMAEEVAHCVANGLLVTMAGVNHDGPYRQPEKLAGLIKSFAALFDQD